MRVLFRSRVWLAAFVAVLVIAACNGDEPAPASEPQVQAVQAAEEEAQEQPTGSAQAEDVEPAEPVEQASGVEVVEKSPKEEESRPTEAAAQSTAAQAEEEEPAEDLTDVPGVVLADADVRVRPGLAWPTVDRLTAGESVLVQHGGGGWYRVVYGDGLVGWIRSTAVDLGDVDEWSTLRQAAPPILAEWRGVEYGVMGQSADGAEVRLLAVDDEQSEILGAPKDEVTLLADDVTLDDLPILIGDETVVFPGDDFRAGQGKILPKANQWMWLPWGWLLAHNDNYIWQWRPGTDELEFTRRPPGYARLSPDGRYLAIADLCPSAHDCTEDWDVTILPLDGSTPISLTRQLRLGGFEPALVWAPYANLSWTANSRAVKLFVGWIEGDRARSTSIVFGVDGRFARFDDDWKAVLANKVCKSPSRLVDAGWNWWRLSGNNTIATDADCETSDGDYEYLWVNYTLDGEFIDTSESSPWGPWDYGYDHIRSATGAVVLKEEIGATWSITEEYALAVDYSTASAWIYDAGQHALLAVETLEEVQASSRLWEAEESESDLRGFYMVSSWRDQRVAAVIGYGFIIRTILLIDAESRLGHFVDPGDATWYPDWHRSQGWSPDGTMYHVASVALDRVDGLGALVFQHLIVNSTGTAVAALHTSTNCTGPGPPGCVIPKALWSPNGKWFAVSGHK